MTYICKPVSQSCAIAKCNKFWVVVIFRIKWISQSVKTNKCAVVSYHVSRFPNLVDLWLITTKKPMILCACSTSFSSEQSMKHRWHRERMQKHIAYSVVKITRMHDYQTWQTHFGETQEVCKGLWAFFCLTAFSGCWLAEQENCDHMTIKVHSFGNENTQNENSGLLGILSTKRMSNPKTVSFVGRVGLRTN